MLLNHKSIPGLQLLIEPCIFGMYSAFLTERNNGKSTYSAHKRSFAECIKYAHMHNFNVPVGVY